MRVLIIEDEARTVRNLSLMLRSTGAVVDQSDSGEEALDLIRHYDYDVVILDLMLSDMEGYEVVRRMRLANVETPVLILSGLCRPQAKIKAFDAGADDFVTKPFDEGELLARIQAVMRRSKGLSQSRLRLGKLEINLHSNEVSVDGRLIPLTGKEYAILELLALRKGFVLSKGTFLNHLYGGMDEPEIKIVDVFVCKLRKKLAEAGIGNLIATVWGRGYMIRDTKAVRIDLPVHAVAEATPGPARSASLPEKRDGVPRLGAREDALGEEGFAARRAGLAWARENGTRGSEPATKLPAW